MLGLQRETQASPSMTTRLRHRWNLSPKQAIALQHKLRDRVVTQDRFGEIMLVAGVDVGFLDEGKVTRAAIAVLDFASLQLLECAVVQVPTSFPYVPGLLSFREIPAILQAYRRLRHKPDLILCDGQGYAHPRRFGLACHLGLALDKPTIGVAKTLFVGEHRAVPNRRGGWSALHDKDEVIGVALRTRRGVKPVFVSVGHRVGLASAIDFALHCAPKFRLPETTRWAHRLASTKTSTVDTSAEYNPKSLSG